MRQRLRKDPAVRREQILDETLVVIGQRGFNGSTVKQLAECCGLSNAGMLHYFDSKEELLLALLNRVENREARAVAPLVAAIEQQMRHGISTLPAVRAFFRAMMQRFSEQAELGRFIVVVQIEAIDPNHPAHVSFRAREKDALELFAKILTPLVAAPRSAARALHGLMNGLAQQWLRAGGKFDLLAEWEWGISTVLPPAAPIRGGATSRARAAGLGHQVYRARGRQRRNLGR